MKNPLIGWSVDRSQIQFLGQDLQRPECILTEPNGTVWTADARGGVVKLNHHGLQEVLTPYSEQDLTKFSEQSGIQDRYIQSVGSLPNGVCFDASGNFIIANWGTNHIETMTQDGKMKTILTEIDGQPLGKANFPLRDSKGRIWFTVTTKVEPWSDQLNLQVKDGYIGMIENGKARIVAEGFNGTNEIRFDDHEEWLYVVESSGMRISRLRVRENGDLYDREVYAHVPGFPDGFAFDAFGNLWATLIFSDELIAITPEREIITLLDDSNPTTKKAMMDAFKEHKLTPELMVGTSGTLCPWMASLSFGGPDLKTVYLGSLRGTRVPYFQSPVAGQKMIHWK